MGSDNLFHKRKAKATELIRRKPIREPYDKILIVCEGSKTEPLYFEELVDYYKIHSANVQVSGNCDSDPVSVVQHGFDLYQKEKLDGSGPFDRVYCVIDRDDHKKYDVAIEMLRNAKPKGNFFLANSVPCFEYWLLLHFNYTTKLYMPCGKTSVGAAVLKDLKKYWPNYTKAGSGSFSATLPNLDFAKANAVRALNAAVTSHAENPFTLVHELVDYLQKMKE